MKSSYQAEAAPPKTCALAIDMAQGLASGATVGQGDMHATGASFCKATKIYKPDLKALWSKSPVFRRAEASRSLHYRRFLFLSHTPPPVAICRCNGPVESVRQARQADADPAPLHCRQHSRAIFRSQPSTRGHARQPHTLMAGLCQGLGGYRRDILG